MNQNNWCIIRDDRWIIPRWIARELVKKTAHTLSFINHTGEIRRREIKSLRAEGLSQQIAKKAVEQLSQSRAQYETEEKAALAQHRTRVDAILAQVRHGTFR